MPYGEPIPIADACYECGDEDSNLNCMPEGQWLCDECCAEYWIEENTDDQGFF